MLPVTACIIAFNEARKLPDCLASVAFCAEVVVVDSHSTDATRELATQAGARVIERDWPGHIAELRASIEQALAQEPAVDGFEVNRRNVYLGRWIKGGGFYPDRKLRLFRRTKGRWGGINPHDHVHLEAGHATRLRGDLEHLTYDGIGDHLRTIDYFSTIAAQEKLSRGQAAPTLQLLFNPPWKFFKMFVLQLGVRDGWRGLIVAALGAFYVFLRYAKLWELIHVQGRTPGTGEAVSYGRRGE